jgi:hypothetical protein
MGGKPTLEVSASRSRIDDPRIRPLLAGSCKKLERPFYGLPSRVVRL